jgi:hypothetical protein
MHWHNFLVNISVHTSYRHNPIANLANPNFIIKEVHYYVYDDPSHDSLFVQHAFMLH